MAARTSDKHQISFPNSVIISYQSNCLSDQISLHLQQIMSPSSLGHAAWAELHSGSVGRNWVGVMVWSVKSQFWGGWVSAGSEWRLCFGIDVTCLPDVCLCTSSLPSCYDFLALHKEGEYKLWGPGQAELIWNFLPTSVFLPSLPEQDDLHFLSKVTVSFCSEVKLRTKNTNMYFIAKKFQ